MKQYITVIVTIVIIIVLNICQHNYLNTTSKYLLADITDIQNGIKRNDFDNITSSIEGLENTWKMVKPIWDIFGEHNDIEDIGEHIVSMKTYAKYKDIQGLYSETAILEYSINHVIEAEKLTIGNVL